jgi:hypothetical protein
MLQWPPQNNKQPPEETSRKLLPLRKRKRRSATCRKKRELRSARKARRPPPANASLDACKRSFAEHLVRGGHPVPLVPQVASPHVCRSRRGWEDPLPSASRLDGFHNGSPSKQHVFAKYTSCLPRLPCVPSLKRCLASIRLSITEQLLSSGRRAYSATEDQLQRRCLN